MKAEQGSHGSGLAPLLHWLLVVGGLLTAYRVLEHEHSGAKGLWVGAVVGTAIGQGVAWRGVSVKALMLLGPLAMATAVWLGFIACLMTGFTPPVDWSDTELGAMAFVPALVCGYASLSERGGLVAFWFPTSLWALAMLDGTDGTTFGDAWSWGLLSVLAALFVAFLAAREARRVSLWQGHATVRLAPRHSTAVLRRSPTRGLSQALWAAAMAASTLALTAWVAPHLWQHETAGSTSLQAGVSPDGAPCCPQASEIESHRLREYFPLLRPHPGASATASCVTCPGEAPPVEGVGGRRLSSIADGPHGAGTATKPATPAPPGQGPSQTVASAAPAQPAPPTSHGALPAPEAEVPRVAASPPGPASHGGPLAAFAPPTPRAAPPFDAEPLPWLLALALSGLLVQLALRPLRRLVTLHHLRDSLWSEPVDQRVSNLWQLALVGMRDAGWHAAPGEQPLALARRADLPGAETCALVLERTRHGARLEATDLRVMTHAAQTVYRAARERIGWVARALSWLRWPLV
jgi:hypothetical protein